MSEAAIGNRKHSVLPDPVPVVTTTSRPWTTDYSPDLLSQYTRCKPGDLRCNIHVVDNSRRHVERRRHSRAQYERSFDEEGRPARSQNGKTAVPSVVLKNPPTCSSQYQILSHL